MTPTARSRSLAALALVATLSLAGCGGASSGSSDAAAPSSAATTAAASAAASPTSSDARLTQGSASTSASADDEACGTATQDQAVEAAKAEIHDDLFTSHTWAVLDGDPAFDPCADLSAIRLYQPDGSTMSAQYVLLFHKGRFYSTAQTEPYGVILGQIRQVDSTTIEYDVIEAGSQQDLAKTTPDATLRYTWDASTGRVTHSGDLPEAGYALPDPVTSFTSGSDSAASSSSTSAAAVPVDGAYPGAGGARPTSATEATGIYTSPYGGETLALIRTPSGNIACDVSATTASCGATESAWRGMDPSGNVSQWSYGLGTTGEAAIESRGDNLMANYESGTAQTVAYGSVIYYGDFVIASTENGVTVWSTKSGHGFLMNKTAVSTF